MVTARMKKEIAIFAITSKGIELGRRLKIGLSGSCLFLPQNYSGSQGIREYRCSQSLKDSIAGAFTEYKSLVLIMAAGISTRLIAHLIEDKHEDPGVVVVDDGGKFAISLLSGHLGGANALTQKVAHWLGATPVITTASDALGSLAVDLLGKEFGWEIEDGDNLTRVSMALIEGQPVGVYQESGEQNWMVDRESLPGNITVFPDIKTLAEAKLAAALIVTDRILEPGELQGLPAQKVIYRPKSLVVGIGCNRGTSSNTIEKAVKSVFSEYNLSIKSIRKLATIDIKQDEDGLLEYAHNNCLAVEYFNKEALGKVPLASASSKEVMKHIGLPGVSEAAALLASGGTLVVPKVAYQRAVTIAVARISFAPEPVKKKGKLFVVGTGPGDPAQMTLRAREVLDQSDVVVGYGTYIDLVKNILGGKKTVETGMGGEVERVKAAIDLAKSGKTVSIVSGGDSGVYGMAGLVGELIAEDHAVEFDLEVVPGVPALAAAAALLGAPLTADFACISLSDHLITWEEIRQRLESAAKGNFVIVLYNPKSRQRTTQLAEAREIILSCRQPDTVVGVVRNAYRAEQSTQITDLEHLLDTEVNMNTIVIIGNSATFATAGWMVTPRGYRTKYDLKGAPRRRL
jgi:cobalt-precorrin 5A hydrolase / precorrin-3B C17-methyltransferase